MHGSFSIKAVLPAVAPDLSYGDLEIVEGGAITQPDLELPREVDDQLTAWGRVPVHHRPNRHLSNVAAQDGESL